MPVMLDLFSGLGGASQVMVERGWTVIRVDIEPRFKPDIVADVRALPLRPFPVDLIWASPPCQEFSRRALPWFVGKFGPPDLELAHSCREIVQKWRPKFWIVENVRAAREWFSPIFGPVRFYSSGHVLWGNLPGLLPNVIPHKGAWGRFNGSGGFREQKRQRGGAIAAMIPREISEAVCLAVERRLESEAVATKGAVGEVG